MHPGMGMYEIAQGELDIRFRLCLFRRLVLGRQEKGILWRERRDIILKLLEFPGRYPSRCLV